MDMKLSRRKFLTTITAGAAAVTLGGCHSNRLLTRSDDVEKEKKKKHILTLSFDDGFKKSSIKQAEIYEKHGFSACFNIIAIGHTKEFGGDWKQRGYPMGDYGLWNELRARGHEIHPHGYSHEALDTRYNGGNRTPRPLGEAKDIVRRCLDMMTKNLKDYDPRKEAVYAFPYGATTPEVNAWLLTQVRAIRARKKGSPRGPNPLPYKGMTHIGLYGRDYNKPRPTLEQLINNAVDQLLTADSGWQVICLHGIDGEAGTLFSSEYLDRLLGQLSMIESVDVLPPIKAFEKFASTV